MLRYLLEKEFKQFARNRFLPRLALMFPLMSLLIFPLVANFDIRNVNLSIVDNDRSPLSRRLVHKAAASGYFRITQVASTYEEGLGGIESDRADIIFEIPNGFERDLYREQVGRVMIAANTVNGTKGGLGSAYLASITNDFASEIRSERFGSPSVLAARTFDVIPQYRFNPELEYRVFMVPAIMVMVLTMMCGFLPALNIVGEKEKGTIEQMNVTPVRRLQFILAKLIPYWVVGFVSLNTAMAVGWFVYGLKPIGGLGTIYLFASVFMLAVSGLGLIISNFAQLIQQAMFMMFFFVMTMIFMSGLYTPVASMPDWAQKLSIVSPLKYFILVMRQVYLKGSGVSSLIVPLMALGCFAIFFNVVAVVSYRKRS